MSRKLHQALKAWMDLERRGPDLQAEEALRQLFLRLPELPLPAGFADRVLARAGLSAPAGALAIPPLALRLAIGLCLALVGASVVLLPATLRTAADLLQAVSWIEVGTTALIGFTQRLVEGLAVWRTLSDIGEILATALDSRMVIAALTSSALLSAGAFRMLYGLMTQDRSSRYASTV